MKCFKAGLTDSLPVFISTFFSLDLRVWDEERKDEREEIAAAGAGEEEEEEADVDEDSRKQNGSKCWNAHISYQIPWWIIASWISCMDGGEERESHVLCQTLLLSHSTSAQILFIFKGTPCSTSINHYICSLNVEEARHVRYFLDDDYVLVRYTDENPWNVQREKEKGKERKKVCGLSWTEWSIFDSLTCSLSNTLLCLVWSSPSLRNKSWWRVTSNFLYQLSLSDFEFELNSFTKLLERRTVCAAFSPLMHAQLKNQRRKAMFGPTLSNPSFRSSHISLATHHHHTNNISWTTWQRVGSTHALTHGSVLIVKMRNQEEKRVASHWLAWVHITWYTYVWICPGGWFIGPSYIFTCPI